MEEISEEEEKKTKLFLKYVIFRALKYCWVQLKKKMSKNLFAIAFKVHQKVLQSPFFQYTGRIAFVGKRRQTTNMRLQICRRQILNGNESPCHFFAYKWSILQDNAQFSSMGKINIFGEKKFRF